MTTFKLPERLGGGEFEGTEDWSGCAGARAEYQIGGMTLTMPPGVLLVVVKPPLRPEPMPGTVVLDKHNRAWQHATCDRGDWCCTLDDLGADWEELNREHGPLLELGSAPEPVELPWVDRDEDDEGWREVRASLDFMGMVYVSIEGRTHLSPTNARTFAVALKTAADQVEATS